MLDWTPTETHCQILCVVLFGLLMLLALLAFMLQNQERES